VALLGPAMVGTPPREPVDWIEGLLPAPAIGALLYGLTMMKQKGLLDPAVLAWLGAGLLLLAWWARRSLGNRDPFIDLRLLAGRNMMIANGTKVLMAMGTMQLVFIFSTYVQAPTWTLAGLGLTATVAGLIMLAPNILALFAGTFSGWLTAKAGVRLPLLLGASVAGAGWLVALPLPGLAMVMLLLCVIMCGTAMMQAGVPNLIVASVPNHRTGEAIGTMAVVQGMAHAIGTQFIALMLASYAVASPGGGAAFPSATSFRLTIGWIAALTIIAVVLSLAIRKRDEAVAGHTARAGALEPADA
jgi:hypothetical protein